jgi:hypothetical protein
MSSSIQRGALSRRATHNRGKMPTARVTRRLDVEEEEESAVENPDSNTKRLLLEIGRAHV